MTLDIRTALRRHLQRLLALPGVEGAAVGERGGRPCITVYVDPGAAAGPPADLPAVLEGYPVVVEATGPFRAAGPD